LQVVRARLGLFINVVAVLLLLAFAIVPGETFATTRGILFGSYGSAALIGYAALLLGAIVAQGRLEWTTPTRFAHLLWFIISIAAAFRAFTDKNFYTIEASRASVVASGVLLVAWAALAFVGWYAAAPRKATSEL
jgi:hypothetical protein